ncbi:2-amino-4-hydroxy-6-hydroxymethyldihydropteridine diphosphokinase [Calycomorphotria hydatis]|uniref:2-amino-4-hydroxy-6-hydroxymethyldihydropteridine diphosphokinase n=1 Tax=Calycomorphotria hydatis TaxID=2528027 RepID=A0A517TF27_9PLAN|nr:2-amino-4-hydroxy-6-hydroxymethyldihydropteridine diphosphokinase [Calycomorphotria hydatis]QDT66980.1 2-amino-4-hydroxy-6-hydroxymethyldihydropteridine pyrophosphokinase [Calycomorphotria hydatis]
MNRVYLGLGSNIDPEEHLPQAVRLLADYGQVVAVSHVYENPPVGYLDQENFLNAAVLLETEIAADEIHPCVIVPIEQALGRVRDPNLKNGPRTIDLDLLLVNDFVGTVGERDLPDKSLLKYAFVAIPMAEIAPAEVHPVTDESFAEIAGRFDAQQDGLVLRPDVDLHVTA